MDTDDGSGQRGKDDSVQENGGSQQQAHEQQQNQHAQQHPLPQHQQQQYALSDPEALASRMALRLAEHQAAEVSVICMHQM